MNFNHLQRAFNDYWVDKDVNAKGVGYKPFRRWEWMMEARIQDGVYRNQELWDGYLKNSSKKSLGNWVQVGPKLPPTDLNSGQVVGTGRIDCIAFHPSDTSIFYVGSPTGGLWKTKDGGQTWFPLTDSLPSLGIADIAIHPQHPDTIYIATGDRDAGEIYSIGVLKSTDGGQTWSTTDLSFVQSENFVVTRLLLNPDHPDTLVAATNKGIYFITKAGDQATLAIGGNFKDLEFKPGDPNVVYAASYSSGYSSVYKSIDAGRSFVISFSGVENSKIRRIALAVTPARSDWVYALCVDTDNSAFEGLYKSADNGNTWESITSTTKNLLGSNPTGDGIHGQGWYDLVLLASPVDTAEIYVGGINIWKTNNSGLSWELVTYGYPGKNVSTEPYVHVDQHALEINPNTGDLFSGNDGGIYQSFNDGESWTDLSAGLEILQIYRIGASASRSGLILMGSQDNSSIRLLDSVYNVIIGGDGMECLVDFTDTNTLFASSQHGHIKYSDDGGYHFRSIVPNDNDEGAWVTPYIMNPENSGILYAGYSNLYKTRNQGQTWQNISSGLTGGKQFNALALSPSNPEILYAATKNLIWRTDDDGINWTSIKTGLPSGVISYIAVSQFNPKELWVTISNYLEGEKVYSSTNGGENWINYSTGLPNVPVNCIVLEHNTNRVLYVGTDLGVFYRNKDMDQWEPFNLGLPNIIVNELEIFYPDNKIRAATYGRGLWESNLYQPDSLPLFANFSANRLQGCLGGTFELINRSALNADSIQWILGADVSTQFSANKDTVWAIFSKEGNKEVDLIAFRNHLADSLSRPDFLNVKTDMKINIGLSSADYLWRGDTALLVASGAATYNWSPSLNLSDTTGSEVFTYPEKDITYFVSATDGICTDLDSLSITVYQNDKIRFASPINFGENGPFINFGASIEIGEPHPPLNDCNTQTDWCDEFGTGEGVLGNTVWFKFEGPPLGIASIDSKGFDNQIAVYSAKSADSLLAGNFELLAANDDYHGEVDSFAAAIIRLDNLIPGQTYWVQVDGSAGNSQGTFYLTLADYPLTLPPPVQNGNEGFEIYPNPSPGTFALAIQNGSLFGHGRVEVYNLQGQLIKQVPIYTTGQIGEILITLQLRKSGIFLVKVTTPDWSQVKKILIQ